jgi:ABC-type transport system substrate-binding protein
MNKLHVFFFTLIISCTNYVPNNHANVLKYNESASITSLDPIFSNNQSNIWATSQIFNTLIELDETMNIQPSIATKWTISPDGLKYTFVIRDDVYYHNSKCFGEDSTRLLVASDFITSISRINNKENLSPGSWVMDYLDIDNIYAINDTLLEFNLSHPFPGMLGMLTMSYFSFVPHEAIEYHGNNFSNHPIGTGPFMFKAWHKNEKLILLKNDNYFEYENEYRLPYLDEFYFRKF